MVPYRLAQQTLQMNMSTGKPDRGGSDDKKAKILDCEKMSVV